jgi:hypothetical protein
MELRGVVFYRKNKQGIVGLPQLSSTAYGYFIFMKLRKQVPFMDLRMELGQEGKKKDVESNWQVLNSDIYTKSS